MHACHYSSSVFVLEKHENQAFQKYGLFRRVLDLAFHSNFMFKKCSISTFCQMLMELFVPELAEVTLGDVKDTNVQICSWGVCAYE